jgi:hypothetical protein
MILLFEWVPLSKYVIRMGTHPTGIIYKSLRGIVCPSSQAYR